MLAVSSLPAAKRPFVYAIVSSFIEQVLASLMRAHTDSAAPALQEEQVSSTNLKE